VRNSCRLVALFVGLLTLLAGCGGDRTGGPQGDAASVVGKAPDTTLAARRAKAFVATSSATATGTVDLVTHTATMQVAPAGASQAEFLDPAVAIDVVRNAVKIDVFGGAEVRGASTIRYELDVAPTPDLLQRLGRTLKGDTFYADVFIDAQFRIRRVIIPINLDERRPSDTHQILAKRVTIDLYDFPSKGS
jgi:hypothetical protein